MSQRAGGKARILAEWGLDAASIDALLRTVIEEQRTIHVIGERWDDVFAGNVVFVIQPGDYYITIFNDCDSLDYVDSIRRGGKEVRYDDWEKAGEQPLNYGRPTSLTVEEFAKLQDDILPNARKIEEAYQ